MIQIQTHAHRRSQSKLTLKSCLELLSKVTPTFGSWQAVVVQIAQQAVLQAVQVAAAPAGLADAVPTSARVPQASLAPCIPN